MKTKIYFLDELDLKGKNVFMRVDFNVPVADGRVLDSRRIDKTLPSIRYVLENGGRLILGSHLGRPNGAPSPQLSLKPVAEYLTEQNDLEVMFVDEPDSEAPHFLLTGLKNPQVILLENLRFHKGETERDRDFAKKLAAYTDVYINEGFSISHRAHASMTLLPEYVPCRGGGLLLRKEMEQLDYIRTKPEHPFFVILGGSKVKDKIPLLESLIDQTDEFFIGGLAAYTFLKARGVNVGISPVETEQLNRVSDFMERIRWRGKTLWLPRDHVIRAKPPSEKETGRGRAHSKTSAPSQGSRSKIPIQITEGENIPDGGLGVDIGPRTREVFIKRMSRSRSLFWNGPMGIFEEEAFSQGTRAMARAVAEHKKAHRVVGGGHSATAIRDYEDQINHISTGGGAGLQYLCGGNIPGIQSLQMKEVE